MRINIEIENLNSVVKDNYLNGAAAVVAAIIKENDMNQAAVIVEEDTKNQTAELGTLKPNDIFVDSAGDKYIVTKQAEGMTYVLRKELLADSMKFGEDNNWTNSDIRRFLNTDYFKVLEERFGAENIIEHETDLLSHDGLRSYGKTIDKVAVRTHDDYREQREILGDNSFASGRWEFLSTPNSTPSGGGSDYVQVVYEDGRVSCSYSDDRGGARPFFALKSSIFVSLNEEE